MSRTRTDYRPAILAKLKEHGSLRLAQLKLYVHATNTNTLSYDLKCLQMEGRIRTTRSLWELVP